MQKFKVHYCAEQGLYYRDPYISKKLILWTILAFFAGNLLGCILFSFRPIILLLSVVIVLALTCIKKVTDGRMSYRSAECNTSIVIGPECIEIFHNFFSDDIEDFSCEVTVSKSSTHTQTYRIDHENLRHVFWYDGAFIMIVNYPPLYASDKHVSSGVVAPVTLNCPISYYEEICSALSTYLDKHPQRANLDQILSYMKNIKSL